MTGYKSGVNNLCTPGQTASTGKGGKKKDKSEECESENSNKR